MTTDEIQFWMLIAFAVVFILSAYKTYVMFNAPSEGMDTQTQYLQLEDIIKDFLKQDQNLEVDDTVYYKVLMQLPILQEKQYKNFNQNRFNQLLQQLYLTYEVSTFEELLASLRNED